MRRRNLMSVLVLAALLSGVLVGIVGSATAGDTNTRAVVDADFYKREKKLTCAPEEPAACDFGVVKLRCFAGDEMLSGVASRQYDLVDAQPSAMVPYRYRGNPTDGIVATATFVPAGQSAVLTLVCADTSP